MPFIPAHTGLSVSSAPAGKPTELGEQLADLAVAALTSEIFLTPKPGLPDCRSADAPHNSVFQPFLTAGRCLREGRAAHR